MRKHRTLSAPLWRRLGIIAMVFALVIAACGADDDTGTTQGTAGGTTDTTSAVPESVPAELADLYLAALEDGNFIVYSAMVPATLEKVAEEFQNTFPGIEMQYIRLTTAPMIERVTAELSSERPLTDVIQVSDTVWPADLVAEGVVANLEIPELENWPAEYRNEGYYFAHQIYLNAIAYNTNNITSDPPTDYWDVIAMGDRASIVDPRGAGGNAAVVFGTMQLYGAEFWEAVRANNLVIHASVATATPALLSGEIDAMIHTHSFPACEKAQDRPVEVVYPESGVWATPQYTLVLSGARHPAAAELFARWVASPAGQSFINYADCTYSPIPGVELNPVLPDFSEVNATVFTADQWRNEFPALRTEATDAAGLPLGE